MEIDRLGINIKPANLAFCETAKQMHRALGDLRDLKSAATSPGAVGLLVTATEKSNSCNGPKSLSAVNKIFHTDLIKLDQQPPSC